MHQIFANNIDNIRGRIPFYGKIPTEDFKEYTWDRHLKTLDIHPPNKTKLVSEAIALHAYRFDENPDRPYFAREIEMSMQKMFMTKITNIAFTGLGPCNKSFPRHKDNMDVFLVQVLGKINIKIDGLHEDPVPFVSGDYYWIPRGTYHRIIPSSSRVTFSFGVEGASDPATYI